MLRTIVAGILIVTLTSCISWTPVAMSPTNYIRMYDPARVWVQLTDSSTMVVSRPRVFADTLRGIVAGTYRNIALKDVARFQAQGPNKKRTAIAVAAAVLGTAALVYIATQTDRTTQ
jgi:hypothetical protein